MCNEQDQTVGKVKVGMAIWRGKYWTVVGVVLTETNRWSVGCSASLSAPVWLYRVCAILFLH